MIDIRDDSNIFIALNHIPVTTAEDAALISEWISKYLEKGGPPSPPAGIHDPYRSLHHQREESGEEMVIHLDAKSDEELGRILFQRVVTLKKIEYPFCFVQFCLSPEVCRPNPFSFTYEQKKKTTPTSTHVANPPPPPKAPLPPS